MTAAVIHTVMGVKSGIMASLVAMTLQTAVATERAAVKPRGLGFVGQTRQPLWQYKRCGQRGGGD